MDIPSSISIGPLTLHFYGLMYALAAIVAFFVTSAIARRKAPQYTKEVIADTILWAMIGGVIGGRIFYTLVYNYGYYSTAPLDILKVWEGGMSIHGGLLGGALGALFYTRIKKIPFWRLVDIFLPALALGLAFGRMGNLINGELPGRITDVPWAVADASGDLRHPWPIYAIIKDLLLCSIFLLLVLTKKWNAGVLAGLFLMTLAVFRFITEFWRAPDPQLGLVLLGLSMGQVLSGLLFATGVLIISLRK